MHRVLVVFVAPALALAIGCHRGSARIAHWSPRFGPVVGNDTIVGRAYADGRVVLLTDGPALIRIDLTRQIVEPRPVSGRGVDILWGLAQLEDGSLWTLAGQRALGKIEADGRISERIQLLAPHVGLFSTGRELVYQELNFLPPADALAAGPPGERSRRRWSGLQTRKYPLARASVAALNLISCGASDSGEVPCWFPDEAAVTLVRQDGESPCPGCRSWHPKSCSRPRIRLGLSGTSSWPRRGISGYSRPAHQRRRKAPLSPADGSWHGTTTRADCSAAPRRPRACD
jgi:hypothetical protein